MELSKRKTDDFIPMGMFSISETGTDLWAMSVKTNKRVWRGLSFVQQRAIIAAMSTFQDTLDEIISNKYKDLLTSIELEQEDGNSTSQKEETTATESATKQPK
jgi:hypothetical protein